MVWGKNNVIASNVDRVASRVRWQQEQTTPVQIVAFQQPLCALRSRMQIFDGCELKNWTESSKALVQFDIALHGVNYLFQSSLKFGKFYFLSTALFGKFASLQ